MSRSRIVAAVIRSRAVIVAAAIALAPCARAKPPAKAAPAPEPQTWLSLALGPGYAHVEDGDAAGLALRLGWEQEKKLSPGGKRFVFAQELTLFAGRSGPDTVWFAAPGLAVRRIAGRLRYGGGAALGFAVGPDHATGHDDWSLPFFAHVEASVDVYRGERLDGWVELGAGAGYPGFYTASVLVGIRAARHPSAAPRR